MAVVSSYYSDKNFLNIAYAIDLSLISHFSSMLFNNDVNRVQYSSNAYAMRKRSDNNNGRLDLPFLNFKAVSYEPGERAWWNASAYTKGVYIPELSQKIKMAPVTIGYEASIWLHKDSDLRYAFSELIFDADNKTILNVQQATYIDINGQTVSLPTVLNYTGLDFEPEYNEQDWLERNNIHSASLDFEIGTFAIKSNDNICIPERVLFNFANTKDMKNYTYDEVYNFLVEDLNSK